MYIFSIIFLLFLSTQFAQASSDYPGLLCETIRLEETKLCIINTNNVGAEWYLINAKAFMQEKIENPPNSMMSIVESLAISPQQEFLAVLSSGEGHPILDVSELDSIITNQTPKILLSLNPYPGWIHFEKWEGNTLMVNSDRLLTHQNLPLYEDGKFAITFPTGRITTLSSNLKNPIKYYINQLKTGEKWQLTEVIDALITLKAVKAIPLVKQLIQEHQHDDLATDLKAALTKLEAIECTQPGCD